MLGAALPAEHLPKLLVLRTSPWGTAAGRAQCCTHQCPHRLQSPPCPYCCLQGPGKAPPTKCVQLGALELCSCPLALTANQERLNAGRSACNSSILACLLSADDAAPGSPPKQGGSDWTVLKALPYCRSQSHSSYNCTGLAADCCGPLIARAPWSPPHSSPPAPLGPVPLASCRGGRAACSRSAQPPARL